MKAYESGFSQISTRVILALCAAVIHLSAYAQGFGPWTQASLSGPEPRYGHAMAFDSARGRLVLFGGMSDPCQCGPVLDGTWEWDGCNWSQVPTPGPSPTPRWVNGMAYDSYRHVTVLFGGESPYPEPVGDTWEWDGTKWAFKTESGPGPRNRFAMAYDSNRHRVVLFGGHLAGEALEDTWEWDGTNWMRVATNGPPARYGHGAAFDSQRGKFVTFGGFTGGMLLEDTWEWDGITWTNVANSGPSPRTTSLAYDSSVGKTLLFGGNGTLADAWAWDGSLWSLLDTNGPSGDYDATIAYDIARSKTIALPGRNSTFGPHLDTWTFASPNSPILDFKGFLAPIGGADARGGSFEAPLRTFKMGTTIPVRFTLALGCVPYSSGVHTLQATKYSSATTSDPPMDATPQGQATTGNEFRLTADGQWQFNLSTKATGMSVGIWLLVATLSDGSEHSAWIQVKN